MTESPYQHMAKEFMDLWQKQIASVVSDKQFIGAMLDLLKTAQTPYERKNKPHAAANAADASDADRGVLAELAFRVAMCEKRLTALEGAGKSAPKSSSKPPQKKSRRNAVAGTGDKRGSKKPRR